MWIDTHCHPFAKTFNEDRKEMLQRAKDAGVSQMIVVGYNQQANRQALEFAEEHPNMWATLGVHPCDVNELSEEELTWIEKMAVLDRVVAIGEMGLDYHHMSFPKEDQEEAFRKQIRLANKVNLPCVVHSRDAAEDTLRILIEEKANKAIFHCFTYDLDFAKKVWDEGYFTSFSGVVTYPKAKDVQEAAKNAPDNLILVETDCPYLAPQSIRGKRCEIANVVEVGEFVAQLRGVSPEELAELSMQNAKILFKLG